MTVHYSAGDSIDLARHIQPGSSFVVGQACGEPTTLLEILVSQRDALSGSTLFLGSAFSNTLQPAYADHLRFRSFGGIGTMRRLAG
ncbi:MAG: acetyl-CoA hydrolase, partial [Burkholderiaceae bacterium]